MDNLSPLAAVNHIENGGLVLVSLPGCISSFFRLSPDGDGIERGNMEIGTVPGMQPGEAFKHFENMLKEGGQVVAL